MTFTRGGGGGNYKYKTHEGEDRLAINFSYLKAINTNSCRTQGGG